jgi:hypothetical protein
MKIQEIVNEELYKALLILEPEYYYKRVGDQQETKAYAEKLFDQIYKLLLPFNPKLKPNFYHLNKAKDKIELWKESWTRVKKGKDSILVRQDDWIEVFAKGGTQVKSNSVDPETQHRTKQKDNMEEW